MTTDVPRGVQLSTPHARPFEENTRHPAGLWRGDSGAEGPRKPRITMLQSYQRGVSRRPYADLDALHGGRPRDRLTPGDQAGSEVPNLGRPGGIVDRHHQAPAGEGQGA